MKKLSDYINELLNDIPIKPNIEELKDKYIDEDFKEQIDNYFDKYNKMYNIIKNNLSDKHIELLFIHFINTIKTNMYKYNTEKSIKNAFDFIIGHQFKYLKYKMKYLKLKNNYFINNSNNEL